MTQFYKHFFLVGIWAIIFAVPVCAQAPQGISYQAIARNNGGLVIANQNIALRFSVHVPRIGHQIFFFSVYETHTANTTPWLFSLFVGSGRPVAGTYSIDWLGAKLCR